MTIAEQYAERYYAARELAEADPDNEELYRATIAIEDEIIAFIPAGAQRACALFPDNTAIRIDSGGDFVDLIIGNWNRNDIMAGNVADFIVKVSDVSDDPFSE